MLWFGHKTEWKNTSEDRIQAFYSMDLENRKFCPELDHILSYCHRKRLCKLGINENIWCSIIYYYSMVHRLLNGIRFQSKSYVILTKNGHLKDIEYAAHCVIVLKGV